MYDFSNETHEFYAIIDYTVEFLVSFLSRSICASSVFPFRNFPSISGKLRIFTCNQIGSVDWAVCLAWAHMI